MRILFLLIPSLFSLTLLAEKQSPEEYIEKYKEIAIIEMHRSGVPASITLAQGILESSSGNSRLARYANNHFGIKCKGNWDGDVIYADDDAPNECFRAYNSVLDSYKDHSEFLRNNWRYHPLFELNRTDYAGWCRGLKKAGYATNPKYHTILINLIERYELYRYDREGLPSSTSNPLTINYINEIPIVIVREGETLRSIAERNDLRERHLCRWNDLEKDQEVKPGDIIYLKPKRKRGTQPYHHVDFGETMYSISQKYGIKLKYLYRKNRMDRGTEPAVGEQLYLQDKRDRDDVVKLAGDEAEEPEFVNPHSVIDSSKLDFSQPGAIGVEQIDLPEYHVIEKGDNIYRIAERYRILEEDLLSWNKHLDPTAIGIGQRIYLSQEAADAFYASDVYREMLEAGKVQDVARPQVEETPLTQHDVEVLQEEVAVTGPVYHMVVKGDTVYNICKRYEVTEAQLKEWNQLDSIVIKIGQKLQVSE